MSDKREMAVVYARYSSSKQHETSIEGQLAAAHKYAASKGYTIVGEYCDRAKTGTNDNREEFQRMLRDCAKHQFTVIIVWKVDRFGRNREEITFNKYKAKKHGVRVEYVAENVSQGPEGVILESVLEGMAEYFSLQLSQNVKRGQLEAAKKHHVISSTLPYGYRRGSDKKHEIDPDTAPIAKKIFEMYASGYTESEIVNWLNSQGFRTAKGAAFGRSSLKKMLHNEIYIGTYTFKDVIREENAVPAIVDRETWGKVQELMKQNRRMPSHKWTYSDYALTGKLYCGECGSAMVGKSGTSRNGEKHCYYACLNQLNKNGCEKKAVRQDVIEPIVIDRINGILHDEEVFNLIVDKTWEYYVRQDNDKAEEDAMLREIEGIDKAVGNLLKAAEQGLRFELIKDRLDELDEQKTAIKKALAERELAKGIKLTKERIQFFLEEMRDLNVRDEKASRRLIETFINRIDLYDDRAKICLNFTGDGNTVTAEDIKKATTDDVEVFECGRSSRARRIRTSN